jgi:hypothetical protein
MPPTMHRQRADMPPREVTTTIRPIGQAIHGYPLMQNAAPLSTMQNKGSFALPVRYADLQLVPHRMTTS